MAGHPFTEVVLTAAQTEALMIARVSFMTQCPFYAHFFYSEMKEVFTLDVPTAATNGRHLIINPEYFCKLKVFEQVFLLAHEVDHAVSRHPQRITSYMRDGKLGDLDADMQHFNVCADYTINAGLVESGIGMMNPDWLWADDVVGADLAEDVYARKWKKPPTTKGRSGKSPGKGGGDPVAAAQGGAFDQLLPPPVDPATGKVDLPTESEFKEAIARAAGAAKAMGKLPSGLAKRIEGILEPQVEWREHIRMTVTGHIGARHETWTRPNRRRLALNPQLILPGRRGYGAELVAIGIDTSGSIYCSPKALEAFFTEVSGILADVRPRRIVVIECDAVVQRVSEISTLDEFEMLKDSGVKGGGGTNFRPVFAHLEKENMRPDTMIFFTDLAGVFPADPGYPTVWATIVPGTAPFGQTVYITA